MILNGKNHGLYPGGRDLDGIKNNVDAYKYGVPVFFGSSSYRDDIEYINYIVNHIHALFPEIPSSKMFVRKLEKGDTNNYERHTMVYIMLDVDTAKKHSSEYIII